MEAASAPPVIDNLPPDILRIKHRINLLGLKRKYVARRVGITHIWFSYIMNGKQPLNDELRKKIFECLNLD